MEPNKKLRWSRRLSVVPRWSIVPTIQRQNVAEHSFHVAQTALWLLQYHITADGAPETMASIKLAVLEHALEHDVDEAATGDRPTTTKASKSYGFMPQHAIIVKVADILEALAFLHEEKLMGNTRLGAVFLERTAELARVWEYFYKSMDPNRSVEGILNVYLKALYVSHPGLETT